MVWRTRRQSIILTSADPKDENSFDLPGKIVLRCFHFLLLGLFGRGTLADYEI